ncbi:MAG: hypothetical protein HOW73_20300 [Polyangiaceae bacterium]|nr:hypothetical protein [Polyangiaceae bacterium]
MKRRLCAASILALMGCSDDSETIGPDPTGSTGSDTSSSTGAGAGGNAQGDYVSGSRIRARTVAGADGSRGPAGWYDAQLETECTWRTASDGETRCLPLATPTTFFADAGCTQPIVRMPCDAAPRYIEAVAAQCNQPAPTIYSVGPAIAAPQAAFVLGANGACDQTIAVGSGFWFSSEGSLAPGNFVQASIEIGQ